MCTRVHRDGMSTRDLQDLPPRSSLLLTFAETAQELRCSLRSVQYLASCHTPEPDRLPTVHMGRSVRVRRVDLEQYVARLAVRSA